MVTILLQKILDLLRKMLKKPGVDETATGSGTVSFTTNTTAALSKAEFSLPYSAGGYTGIRICNLSDSDKLKYFKGLVSGDYAFVDLSTLTWTTGTGGSARFVASPSLLAKATTMNIICNRYTTAANTDLYNGLVDDAIAVHSNGLLWVRDTTYATADAFKASLSGCYAIYELASAVTPTITPEQFKMLADAFSINGEMIDVTWSEEDVYGGSFNAVTGILTSSYDESGEPLDPEVEIRLEPVEILSYNGNNNIWTDANGDITVSFRYKIETQAELQQAAGSGYTDLTSGLSIDYQTIEESSSDVRVYRIGNLVYVQIQNLKYLFMPEETAVIITGLPKPKLATNVAVADGYDLERCIRLRVNTDGELQQWYCRPAGNHVAVGQFVYITDEV